MEGLLTNNIFFIYLLGTLVIINYEAFEKRQKIAIIYACSFGLTFNGDLRCILIILLLLFILFLYEEYLNEDLVKIKYITKIWYKILDFFYMYIFHYKLFYVIIALVLKSNVCSDFFVKVLVKSEIPEIWIKNVLIFIAVLLLIAGVHKMFNDPIELKNFGEINQKFSEYPYYQFQAKDEEIRSELFEKLELVADIEDYTFFEREKSYSCLSCEFIKIVFLKKKRKGEKKDDDTVNWIHYVIERMKVLLTMKNLLLFLKKKKKISILIKYAKKFFVEIKDALIHKLDNIMKKVKRYIRGYSTIEMQLIRILAFQKGLKLGRPQEWKDIYLILTRKIYEVIYARIFFDGYKNYLDQFKKNSFYRYYLVYIYLHTVRTKLNGRVYEPLDKIFGDVDIAEWPKEVLLIIVLGLNGMRITHKRIEAYGDVVDKYQLDEKLLHQLIDCIE